MVSWRQAGGVLGRSLASILLSLLAGLAAGCGSLAHTREPVAVQSLTDGPTRWIMLPEEEKRARRLRTNREAITFIEDFWRRRDPDPEKPGNPFLLTFNERVEAADHLYGEAGERGSLTPRGRALVLLGPPPRLAYGQQQVPAWEPGHTGTRPLIQNRKLTMETWTYPGEDLAPRLRELLKADGKAEEIVLVFSVEPRNTLLLEGGKLLDLAAHATVRDERQGR